jgi:hypothetical protein
MVQDLGTVLPKCTRVKFPSLLHCNYHQLAKMLAYE